LTNPEKVCEIELKPILGAVVVTVGASPGATRVLKVDALDSE